MTGEEFEEEVQTVKRIEGIVMIVVSDAIPIIALLKGTAWSVVEITLYGGYSWSAILTKSYGREENGNYKIRIIL